MIEVRGLTKRYRSTLAVDDLTFTVLPGRVTAFLGPNGAGKSTTMRMMLGLDAPTDGTALVNGAEFAALPWPSRDVGALLDANAAHPGRRARTHLLSLARAGRIGSGRVDEVLELTGLTSVATRRVGGFSLGMKQRLGIATAMLGDPGVLILDEPVNGLDVEGIHWIRGLLRLLAGQGRTIFVSSHLMGEMEQTADQLIVIGRGRLVAETTMSEFVSHGGVDRVMVRSPRMAELVPLLRRRGGVVEPGPDQSATITGLGAGAIADIAAAHRISIHELTRRQPSLEEAYLRLTDADVEFRAAADTQEAP